MAYESRNHWNHLQRKRKYIYFSYSFSCHSHTALKLCYYSWKARNSKRKLLNDKILLIISLRLFMVPTPFDASLNDNEAKVSTFKDDIGIAHTRIRDGIKESLRHEKIDGLAFLIAEIVCNGNNLWCKEKRPLNKIILEWKVLNSPHSLNQNGAFIRSESFWNAGFERIDAIHKS